jgi:hypothetical protein
MLNYVEAVTKHKHKNLARCLGIERENKKAMRDEITTTLCSRSKKSDACEICTYHSQLVITSRCGPMDKAPAYGAGDSRFESVQWYLFLGF